jgi:5-methylthioribose kinase
VATVFTIDNDANKLREYLEQIGYLETNEDATIVALGGGVSNDVFRVVSQRGAIVVKQALHKLRVKDDWFIDPERANVEKDYLKLILTLLGDDYAPAVVFEDEENCLFAMEHAPDGSKMWKELLLSGQVDRDLARLVAQLLARLHNETYGNQAILERFDYQQRFIDCRVDPYFETIARRHPELEQEIRTEINRVLVKKGVLVHGDYSPKNILLFPDRKKIWLLDGEVAHIGNPSFDTAFLLNHLLLKAVHVKSAQEDMLEAFRQMGTAYLEAVTVFPADWMEENTCRELGLMMLARVDGKSPAEYLNEDERVMVRRASTRIIRERPKCFHDLAEIVVQEIEANG